MTGVVLKPGKEKAILNRHHWIFSGAVASLPQGENGEIFPVYSASKQLLGSAYINRKAKIIGRMIAFGEANPYETLKQNIDAALALRIFLFHGKQTNAYRLINAEGDCLPGLIVDKYADHLVVQISTLGMEKLRSFIIEYLQEKLRPVSIYEKSHLPSRKEEGLLDVAGPLFGTTPNEIQILENGVKFIVSPIEGQKTGFFLDHREMRQRVRELAKGLKVLNCFSYTGGFSAYAALGGATAVDSVDISAKAIELAERNVNLNSPSAECHFYAEDVFDFLRNRPLNYNLIILDPPAFAKRQKDVIQACRGYKDINRVALQKIPSKSILITSSCSHHVDEALFQKVVFQAAVESKRTVKIMERHRLAGDHPINICHPETDYLKSLVLFVD